MESMHVGNELIINIKVNVSTFSKHEYTSLTKHIYYIKHEVSYASLSMTKTVFFVVSDMYIIRTRTTSTPIPRNEIFDMEDHMTSVTIILYYHTLDTKLPRGFHYLKKTTLRASNCTTVALVVVGPFFNRTFSIYYLMEFSRYNMLEINLSGRVCCLTNHDIIWYALLFFVVICMVIALTHWGLLIHTAECRYSAVQCSKILHQ